MLKRLIYAIVKTPPGFPDLIAQHVTLMNAPMNDATMTVTNAMPIASTAMTVTIIVTGRRP
jgi:uncharacterized membrane protein (DUF485 family)